MPAADFAITPQRPQRLAPETHPWFFNPNRPGAKPAPEEFQRKLREIDPDGLVDFRWNPVKERWAAFYRNHAVNQPSCRGWQLLFWVQYADGSYMPLDERALATLYAASAKKWGDGVKYFDAIEREMERDREKHERQASQEAVDRAMPSFDYGQIKVSMRGPSNGSKFADFQQ